MSDFDLSNKQNKENECSENNRGGSGIKNWIEDSLQKVASPDTYNIFEKTVFSGSKADEKKKLKVKNACRFKRNKNGKPFELSARSESDACIYEPPRAYYCNMDESERLAKLSWAASSDIFASSENSVTSCMSSILNFAEKDIVRNDEEKIEFINKYNEAKKNEKKYKKEIKILKLEK